MARMSKVLALGVMALTLSGPVAGQTAGDGLADVEQVREALAECRPAGRAVPDPDPDTNLTMHVSLNQQGLMGRYPAAQTRRSDDAERSLYRRAVEGLTDCFPIMVGDRVLTGSIILGVRLGSFELVSRPELAPPVEIQRTPEPEPAPAAIQALPMAVIGTQPEPGTQPGSAPIPGSVLVAGIEVSPYGDDSTEASLDLSLDARKEVQGRLSAIGFDTNGVDGVFGRNTRGALEMWQDSHGLSSTGYLNASQFKALLLDSNAAYASWKLDNPQKKKKSKARRVKVCQRILGGLALACRYEWRR